MSSTTPKKMMTKRRIPAMTPAIFTVWSVCFSGSTASGLWVAAPEKQWWIRVKQIEHRFEHISWPFYVVSHYANTQVLIYIFSISSHWFDSMESVHQYSKDHKYQYKQRLMLILTASDSLLSWRPPLALPLVDISALWIKLHWER